MPPVVTTAHRVSLLSITVQKKRNTILQMRGLLDGNDIDTTGDDGNSSSLDKVREAGTKTARKNKKQLTERQLRSFPRPPRLEPQRVLR